MKVLFLVSVSTKSRIFRPSRYFFMDLSMWLARTSPILWCLSAILMSRKLSKSSTIMAGVEQVVEYLSELEFADEDIEYLRGKGIFDDKFLNYLNFALYVQLPLLPSQYPLMYSSFAIYPVFLKK